MRISGAATTRNLLGPALRGLYRVRLTGAHHVPRSGGVLLVANHDGLADATILALSGQRPVEVVADGGTLPGLWERVSGVTGRIVVGENPDSALRDAVRALTEGRAVGMFPEGSLPDAVGTDQARAVGPLRPVRPGAAYAQVRSGVPVVPVALLGTAGTRPTDPPRPRSILDIVYGEPFVPAPPADPWSRAGILAVAEVIRQRLSDHVDLARARTGRTGHNGAL